MAVFFGGKTQSERAFIEYIEGQDIYGTDFTGNKALKNSDIYTGVNILASDIAQSSFKHKNPSNKDDNVLRILNKQPNHKQSHFLFMYSIIANLVLTGNSYAVIHKGDNDELESLEFFTPECVNIVQNIQSGEYTYEVTPQYGNELWKLTPDEILHFRISTVDGFVGRSPLLSLQSEVAMQTNGLSILNKFFSKGVFNGGQLKLKGGSVNNEAKKQIRQDFEKVNGSGGVMILDETQEFSETPVNTDILKLIQGNDFSTKQIAKVLGIPINRFGMELVNSADNVQNDIYIASTLSTYEQSICDEIFMKLGIELELDISKLVNDTVEDRLKLAMSGKLSNEIQKSIKINEARRYFGLEDIPEGEKLIGSEPTIEKEVYTNDNEASRETLIGDSSEDGQ